MNPQIMASIQDGPNQAHAQEYASVNGLINELSAALANSFRNACCRNVFVDIPVLICPSGEALPGGLETIRDPYALTFPAQYVRLFHRSSDAEIQ